MPASRSTCWTTIERASAGDRRAREEFAERYDPLIRAYLAARWRRARDSEMVGDAVQEVFVECFRADGILDRMPVRPPQEFRAFLYGVVRNVARRVEKLGTRPDRAFDDAELLDIEAREQSLSTVFDRAWAESIVAEAAELLAQEAQQMDEAALRRVEILRLRFGEDKPVREIADLLDLDPVIAHRQYRTARAEFRRALVKVVRFHHPDSQEHADRALSEVLTTLAGFADESGEDSSESTD